MVHYLETGSTDPFFNLAFEEYLLLHRTVGDYLMLWQNDNTIVIGLNQNADEEINADYVRRHQIHVVRRNTGGGAVFHDLGNLNYSFITDAGDDAQTAIRRFTALVVAALQGLGLQAEASGRNDILVNGKKVSGAAQRLVRGRVLHHGTLLFQSDAAVIESALRIDSRKYESKSTKSVRSRVGNIRDALVQDCDLSSFWSYLRDTLAAGGYEKDTLSDTEKEAVEQLMTNKYMTRQWNYGRFFKYNVQNKCKWPGGFFAFQADIVGGKIADISFLGDFLSLCEPDVIANAMAGCPFSADAVSLLLDRFPLPAYFGEITKEEILLTMFPPSRPC